jgi:hypothetical protein
MDNWTLFTSWPGDPSRSLQALLFSLSLSSLPPSDCVWEGPLLVVLVLVRWKFGTLLTSHAWTFMGGHFVHVWIFYTLIYNSVCSQSLNWSERNEITSFKCTYIHSIFSINMWERLKARINSVPALMYKCSGQLSKSEPISLQKLHLAFVYVLDQPKLKKFNMNLRK